MPRRSPSSPSSPPRAGPRERREAVEVVQGLRAGLAVLERRRDDVVRVAHGRATWQESAELGAELKRLAGSPTSRHVSCEEVTDAELDRLAESSHHEGL